MESIIGLVKALTELGGIVFLIVVARGFLPLLRDQAPPPLSRSPDREPLPPPAPPSMRLPRRQKSRRRPALGHDHGE